MYIYICIAFSTKVTVVFKYDVETSFHWKDFRSYEIRPPVCTFLSKMYTCILFSWRIWGLDNGSANYVWVAIAWQKRDRLRHSGKTMNYIHELWSISKNVFRNSLPNCTQRICETRKNNHCAVSMASLKYVFYALWTELPSENFIPGWSEGNNFFFRKVKWNASEFSYVNSFSLKRNEYVLMNI